MLAFILILKPATNAVTQRTNLRSSGHTHVVQNNLRLQMPHLGFSYGLWGLNSGPLAWNENTQLPDKDWTVSPPPSITVFFHFVVLFFNPSINSYNVSKENKTSPKEKLQGRKTVQHVGRRYILVKSRGIVLWLTYRKFVQAFKDQFEKTFCKKHVARFGVYQDRLAKLKKHLFSPTSKIV